MATREPTPPLSTRVDQVAKTLRCPTCAGESVAASDTPIARSMRSEISHQLQEGRTPDQVRAWFVQRYGADIVTRPSARGPELLLWVLPIGVLALGGLVLVARSRRGPPGRPENAVGSAAPRALSGRRVLVAVLVCAAAGAAVPAAVALPSSGDGDSPSRAGTSANTLTSAQWVRLGRSLDRQGDPSGAENAYRRALALTSADPAARTRLGFDLLGDRDLAAAEQVVRPVARRPGQYRPLALLVLGLAQRGRAVPAADATLRTFLRLAPHHPAAPQVRRLLRSRR
jgi:cytochrome c-type biogenesis protein CcmH/NrfF